MTLDLNIIKSYYDNMVSRIEKSRQLIQRPLTYAEKILFSHLAKIPQELPVRGETYVNLNPDRVAMQDATAQMAVLQFMQAFKDEVSVPTSIHCDHLIPAKDGAIKDLENAKETNKEVYDFLESASRKFGIGFWGPGSGIIHQIIFENYAFPGGMMIGTDSHTPNAGGIGMAGIGVGGADAVDVMVGMPWELKWPKLIGVKLTGKLQNWASAKDIILKLLGILTVKGGTGSIVEYFGAGIQTLSATGKATITNMGAELGATTSIFPYDENTYKYLVATNRKDVADLAEKNKSFLQADEEVYLAPQDYYDQVIEINLNELESHLVGPFTPDLTRAVSKMKEEVVIKNYPRELKVGMIGSCTNSSYEDLNRVASILKDAMQKGLKAKSHFFISPGSEQIKNTIERDGILKIFEDFGAVIFSNSCGPCIGQWVRKDFTQIKPNSIITSFNRNFKSRNDGNPETLAFIGSPEFIAAAVIAGTIDFDPLKDSIRNDQGVLMKLDIPHGAMLPPKGFASISDISIDSSKNKDVEVIINDNSQRLDFLTPFEAWDKNDDIRDCQLLLKAKGKCTTDHISPAGKWLQFRGHLDNISNNMYLGALNAFTKELGTGLNQLNDEKNQSFSKIARYYKQQKKDWVVIGDENYGEGSSREHAAMEPRHLGCKAIVARSFARIAENNLKKQGVLVATFQDGNFYDKIQETDILLIKGLTDLAPGSILVMEITHVDKTKEECLLNHSLSAYQIEWFKAGSSLNYIRNISS